MLYYCHQCGWTGHEKNIDVYTAQGSPRCPKCRWTTLRTKEQLQKECHSLEDGLKQIQKFERDEGWKNFKKPPIKVKEGKNLSADNKLYYRQIDFVINTPHCRELDLRCSLVVEVWKTIPNVRPSVVIYDSGIHHPRHLTNLQHDDGDDFFWRNHIRHLFAYAWGYEAKLKAELFKLYGVQEDWTKKE